MNKDIINAERHSSCDGKLEENGKQDYRYSYMTSSPDWYPLLLENARLLRRYPTPAERMLWAYIHDGVDGVKFRRQQIIGDFIADFASLKPKLVIELDGEYHQTDEQKIADMHRTDSLQRQGFFVIRFSNEEVFNDINKVRQEIKDTIKALSPALPETGKEPI